MNLLSGYELIEASSPYHFLTGATLFREYAAGLNFDLEFQGFHTELDEIAVQYSAPSGGLLLLRHTDRYVGCAGIRRWDDRVAELKRMYIQVAHRGKGLGSWILADSISLAKNRGYKWVRLDTLKGMEGAIRLYRAAGFYPIGPYRFNPSEDVLYFEKDVTM